MLRLVTQASSDGCRRPARLNRMVKSPPLDRTFSALADPTRRDILERLGSGPATLSELAQPIEMTMPGVLKHVRILEEARLVTTERVGRTRECRLGPERLDHASQWIDAYRRRWERRLDRFERYLERQKGERT
jgi:DNA-binding transcriptional ArsR family regulator